MKNLILGLTVAAGIFTTNSTQAQDLSDPTIIARSQVSPGDTARLGRVLAKARRGEGVTIGVIGGSITQGTKASVEAHR